MARLVIKQRKSSKIKVVHVIRHGEAQHNVNEKFLLKHDTKLTKRGQRQAKSLHRLLPKLKPQAAVTSAVLRALQTTRGIGFCGPTVVVPEAREVGGWPANSPIESREALSNEMEAKFGRYDRSLVATGPGRRSSHWESTRQVFALLVACYCHDLDHRGTNNAFQTKTESPLAQLYGTSTMEHHHFDHCIMILNSEGNNIFEGLSPDDYRYTIKILEHAILSTDLALYFQKRGSFEKVVHCDTVNWSQDSNRELLRAMMMTACDVAAITKPWEIQHQVAELVASEFFEQGDMERFQLNSEPIPMMDRKKKDELPKMQVGFIDFICIPVYKLFYDLEPCLKPFYDGCVDNRNNWQSLADNRNEEAMNELKKTSSNEDKNEANNNKRNSTAQKVDKLITSERKISETKDSTSGVNNKNIGDKKSKTCSIL